MGTGFFVGKEQGIRSLENKKSYPRDKGEVHDEGLIIGGAFWDLRKALITRYGERRGADKASYYFYRHLLAADSYLDSSTLVLALDDDDANPATRSPNYCLIVEAFKAHGLSSENSCKDGDTVRDYEVASELLASLLKGEDQNLFGVSLPGKKELRIEICEASSVAACLREKGKVAEFQGVNEGRLIYTSPLAALEDGKIYTVLVRDLETDVLLSGRQFRLSAL